MPKKTKKQKQRAEAHRHLDNSSLTFSFKSNATAPNLKHAPSVQPASLLLNDIRKSVLIGFVFISIEIVLAFMSK